MPFNPMAVRIASASRNGGYSSPNHDFMFNGTGGQALPMITTVTLNPMLDKTVRLPQLAVGRITRAGRVSCIVGGKGVNVTRQLHRLGCPSQATGLWGGEVGLQCDRLLTAEGIKHQFVRIEGMTREGVTYVDAAGVMTCIFEPSHNVTPAEAEIFVGRCSALLADSRWLACCGSSPSAATDYVYADLLREARTRGVRTALDTYGTPLHLALAEVPEVMKVNREEYRSSAGTPLERERDVVDALVALVEQGIALAVLTDGPRPCYAASRAGCWKITPPTVTTVNPTGSGDSMLAGILYGLSRGWDHPGSICFGAAAGAANAAAWDVSSVSMQDILSLLPSVAVSEFIVP
jgi:tagatose 6-phosphate kinase